MSNIPILKPQEVVRILKNLGFVKEIHFLFVENNTTYENDYASR